MCWVGTADTTTVAPASASSRSVVAASVGGRSIPGRKTEFCRSVTIDSTTSPSSAQMVVATPSRARRRASAVPHDPPPITATLRSFPTPSVSRIATAGEVCARRAQVAGGDQSVVAGRGTGVDDGVANDDRRNTVAP